MKNNTDFWFFFQGTARETDKTKRRKIQQSGSHHAKDGTKKEKEDCWQVKTSSLSWDYPRLGVQTAGRKQNKGHDWRADVPFIRLCRHTPHTQPLASDNNSANTHQQIMRTRKTCNMQLEVLECLVAKIHCCPIQITTSTTVLAPIFCCYILYNVFILTDRNLTHRLWSF